MPERSATLSDCRCMQRMLHCYVYSVVCRDSVRSRLFSVATSTPEKRETWLLVTVSTGNASSTLRVHSWRKLRSLGARYLHKSVAVLPYRPETARAVNRLIDRVRREGGQASSWTIEFTDPAQERDLIESFQAERSDEYHEVCSRVSAFLAEIESGLLEGSLDLGISFLPPAHKEIEAERLFEEELVLAVPPSHRL
ncbi:MAG: hypothetical protein C4321_10790, partial [Chloroflexota bacterium]